ncbi:MAG: PqqD family protein [candidate division WS1 bacterium]|jgi:hypothetical protein|nr:PqqD family protein [candidate division WS1 bacterium]
MRLPRFGHKPSQAARPAVTRQQALRIYPVRNPGLKWKLDEQGLVRATLVRRRDLWGKLIGGILSTPDARDLQLDEIGSFVWMHCDGEHTLNDIVESMMEKYKLGRREVEASLNEFLRMLAKRGMIVVGVPKALIEEMDSEVVKGMGLIDLETLQKPPAEETDDPADESA